jgi:FkbM family methyltransferase
MFSKLRRRSAAVAAPAASAASSADFHFVGDAFRTLGRGEAESYIAARTRFAYLGNNRGIAVVLGKYKMLLDTTDQGFAPHMIFDGYWEYWLSKFLADNIRPGDVACDIGANLGYYSILMSELVGPAGKVHCFEPNPAICNLLRGTVGVNGFGGRSTVHQVALSSAEKGEVAFYVPRNEPKNAMIVQPGFQHPGGETISVPTARFDSLPFDKLDFLKIDVEGAELEVLRGLQQLKQRFEPKIVCEVNFGRGYSYDKIVELLGHNGELQHIDYSGEAVLLTRDMVERERIDEDWLVYYPGR